MHLVDIQIVCKHGVTQRHHKSPFVPPPSLPLRLWSPQSNLVRPTADQMPSPMNKRRRISEDGKSSPMKQPTVPSRKPNVLPSFMTPTKASLAKSYPHLVPKSQPRGVPQRTISPIRQAPRRSIPPERPSEVFEVNGPGVAGRRFMDIENETEDSRTVPNLDVEEPTGIAVTGKGKAIGSAEKETHLSNEEEIERQKSALMRRLRLLRAECENLETQVEQAKQAQQIKLDTQKKAHVNVDTTIQSLLRSNDTSLAQQPATEPTKSSLPTAAPKKLKNPLPLLRFIHPLTFYSTTSHLIPSGEDLIRRFQLKGYAMERELYFDLDMSVNENQERITYLQIKTSPWARAELSPFLQRLQSTHNIQAALTALSTYAKLSFQRTRAFSLLAKDLVDLIPPALGATINTVSKKGKEREGESTLPIYRVQKLLRGERSITFQRGAVALTVSWDIKVDSLGFAGSNLSIATKIPSNWREADDRGVLDGLAGVFDSLVRRFGIERAVRTIAGVIFEEV